MVRLGVVVLLAALFAGSGYWIGYQRGREDGAVFQALRSQIEPDCMKVAFELRHWIAGRHAAYEGITTDEVDARTKFNECMLRLKGSPFVETFKDYGGPAT